MNEHAFETAKSAVVQVGYGRGFIVSAGEYAPALNATIAVAKLHGLIIDDRRESRYIITAAHCLPRWRLPTPHLANSAAELTFPRIIGPLGSKRKQQTIWAELCFYSLADDLAVLAEPDGQVLWDQHDEYEAFTEQATKIGRSPRARQPYEWTTENETPAWLLSLDGQWQRCTVQNGGRYLAFSKGGQQIKSGMSGSCIVDDNGAAIGAVSTGGSDRDGGSHPSLTDCLPPWLLRKLDGIKSVHARSPVLANRTETTR